MIWLTFFLLGSIFLSWCGTKLKVPFAKQTFIILLILVIGLRYNVGRDYPTYEIIYDVPDSTYANYVEPIWHLINYTLRSLGFASRGFFFLTSLMLVMWFYKGIKKMSPHFYVSVALFIICGFYYESANIVRQFIAISILFYSYPYLLEGKITKYLLWSAFAALFHVSVLIILPIILLSRFRYSIMLLLSGIIISFALGNSLLNLIVNFVMPSFSAIELYQYDVDDFDAGVGSGVLKLFYNLFILAILALYHYCKSSKSDPYFHMFLNMVIFGVILYNTFYLFQPARRLYLYFFTYLIILIPYCMDYFKKSSQYITIGITSLIFFAFLIKQNLTVPYDFDFSFF